MHYRIHTIVVGLVLLLAAGKILAEVHVSAQVDTSKDIYVGERFTYQIVIDGEGKPGRVNLAPLAHFDPQDAGGYNASQTSITIINGKTTQTATKRYIMSYLLLAQEQGSIKLPSVEVMVDGELYRTNPVEVNVLQPGATDKLKVEFSVSQNDCYVGQPITMTVNLYIAGNIQNTDVGVPVFRSGDFYFEEPAEHKPTRTQREMVFDGIRVLLTEERRMVNGVNTGILSFSKILIPKKAGRFILEPVSLSTDMAVGTVRTRNIFDRYRYKYERFLVKSEPVELTVQPLPDQGQPEGFYGLVGRYGISASAEPTKVNVGDPITLTIKVGPNKYLKPVRWPDLENIPGFAESFRMPSEKASPVTENDFKVFTQTIRATSETVTEIPAIPLVYFDVDKGRYIVARSEPIELEVAPTKILTASDAEGGTFEPVNREVEAIRKGLSANYEGLDVLQNQSFSPAAAILSGGYLVTWAGSLGALFVSVLVKLLTHTTAESEAAKRRRRARAKAIGQIKTSIRTGPSERAEQLLSAMKNYVAERFDRAAGALTAQECGEIIEHAGGSHQTAQQFCQIIFELEAARYAPVGAQLDSMKIKQIVALIAKIDRRVSK